MFKLTTLHLALTFFSVVLSSGCNNDKFVKDHPQAAEIIEDGIEITEDIAESEAESELHLPKDSLKPVFKHKLFDKDKANQEAPSKN